MALALSCYARKLRAPPQAEYFLEVVRKFGVVQADSKRGAITRPLLLWWLKSLCATVALSRCRYGDTMTALGTTSLKHCAAPTVCHTLKESMCSSALYAAWLICTFHNSLLKAGGVNAA